VNRNEEWAQVAVDHAAVGPRDVTRLLQAWGDGDAQAAADLTDLVYLQIRAIAGKQLRGYAGQ
jgi:hypothetical protein